MICRSRYYKVIAFEALWEEDLPKEYTDNEPCVYKSGSELVGRTYYKKEENYHCSYSPYVFCTGARYKEDDFNRRLDFVKKCGERLRKINKRLAKENAEWNGKIVHII